MMDHCTRTSCIGLSAPMPLTAAIDTGTVLIIALVAALVLLRWCYR